jgi:hypothetical protein
LLDVIFGWKPGIGNMMTRAMSEGDLPVWERDNCKDSFFIVGEGVDIQYW